MCLTAGVVQAVPRCGALSFSGAMRSPTGVPREGGWSLRGAGARRGASTEPVPSGGEGLSAPDHLPPRPRDTCTPSGPRARPVGARRPERGAVQVSSLEGLSRLAGGGGGGGGGRRPERGAVQVSSLEGLSRLAGEGKGVRGASDSGGLM